MRLHVLSKDVKTLQDAIDAAKIFDELRRTNDKINKTELAVNNIKQINYARQVAFPQKKRVHYLNKRENYKADNKISGKPELNQGYKLSTELKDIKCFRCQKR